jgi:hypothetical protein
VRWPWARRKRGKGQKAQEREGCGPDRCKEGGRVLGHHGPAMLERKKERKREIGEGGG